MYIKTSIETTVTLELYEDDELAYKVETVGEDVVFRSNRQVFTIPMEALTSVVEALNKAKGGL